MTALGARPKLGQDVLRRRTLGWVMTLATLGLIFDGYDLVVYGTVVATSSPQP